VSDRDGWVEAIGTTVDEAIDAVLDELDLDEQDAEIEVFRPSKGRLGTAAEEPVRVRARAREVIDLEDEGADEEIVSDEEKIDVARSFCVGMLDAFELRGEAEAWVDDDGMLRVEIEGDDLGILIGRKGKTLQSLAELVRTVVQRQTGARTRLFVDVQGYRASRREALVKYATGLARRVVETGVEVALEPMTAGDRKVVHDTVNRVAGAQTLSEGEEPRRYVVISSQGARGQDSPRRSRRRR
jgi:spoIIIJ-associated protein